jgi:hypothetical protein
MAEPKISTQPIAEKKSSYRKWIEAEGMALMEGFYIEDIKDVPLQSWERTGGTAVKPTIPISAKFLPVKASNHKGTSLKR